jgi:WD40 repeat protein
MKNNRVGYFISFKDIGISVYPVCKFLLIIGLIFSQTACQEQGGDVAKLVQTLTLQRPPMNVAWRPDGKQLAIVGFGKLSIFEVSSGKQIKTPSLWAVQSSLQYSPDGRFLVLHRAVESHQGMSALVWLDANDYHVVREYFNEYPMLIPSMAFSPDSRLLVVGGDKYNGYLNIATVFDVKTGAIVAKLKTLHSNPNYKGEDFIQKIVYSPDGATVIIGFITGKIDVWSTKNWHLIKTFKAHKGFIDSLAISPNGKSLATGSISGGINIHYDPATRTTIETKYDDPIKLWDTSNWKLIGTLPSIDKDTTSLVFLPNSKFLVSANQNKILFWNVETKKQIGAIEGFKGGGVMNFSLSPDGDYLAIVGIGNLDAQIWKISSKLHN